MKYAGKEIQLLVKPFNGYLQNYVIYYRIKKRFNLFNPWKRYEYTWHMSVDHFDRNQPYLYENFDHAHQEASLLKSDPTLIDINNEREDAKYRECLREYNEWIKKRSLSTIL